MWIRLIILGISLVCAMTLQAQFPTGGSQGEFGNTNQLGRHEATGIVEDTLDRPQLKVLKKSLTDEFSPNIVDTLYNNIHIVEPFYNRPFFAPNLGSENSATQATPIRFYNEIGLELGHDQYRPLLDQFDPYEYYDTNRSYWGIHYGRGAFLRRVPSGGESSDNLQVDFYRRFARGIKLNFEFDTYSDDSWIGTQTNRQRNVAIKLIQEANRGNRRSYISLQNYTVNEAQSRSFLPNSGFASDNANSTFSDFHLEFGNQINLRDSLFNSKSLILRSALQFKSNRYTFIDEDVQDSEQGIFLPVELAEVNLNNHLRTTQFRNDLILKGQNSEVTTSIVYQNKSVRNTRDTIPINEIIFGLSYERDLTESIHFAANGKLGIIDIAGEVSLGASIEHNANKWPFQVDVTYKLLNPSIVLEDQVIDSLNIWQNDFVKSSYSDIHLRSRVAGFDIALSALQIRDGVFLDTDATPTQLNTTVTSLSAMLSRDIDFGIFKSQHRLIYNRINSDVILAPEVQLAGNFSVGTFLSKYQARLDVGVDYYLIPSYNSPAFHHVFGRFYNNGLNQESGDIAILNPYLTLQVESLAFFIKSVNATALPLSSQRLVNLTPVQDRGLYSSRVVFGLKWRLLD